jgi:hypothetical protein
VREVTRDELAILPPTIQLKLLWSVVLDGAQLASVPTPKQPRPPKYDLRIGRQGGVYQWGSETSLEGLRFWYDVQKKRPSSDPKYEEADKRRLQDYERWINWREWEPNAPWQGERDRKAVLAPPPMPKPRTYKYERRQQQEPAEANGGGEPSYASGDDYDPLG